MASKRGSTSGKKAAVESSPSQSDVVNHQTQVKAAEDTPVVRSETSTTSTTPVHREASVTNNQGAKRMSGMSVMEFSEDLNNQEAPPPLPVQEYPAEIIGAEIKTSPNTGNDYLAVTFKIHPDAYPADFEGGNPEGEVLSYNRLVMQDTPQARYRVRKFLEAVGGKLGKTLDPNELLGLTATVGVTHQEYEGEKRAQIAKVTAA